MQTVSRTEQFGLQRYLEVFRDEPQGRCWCWQLKGLNNFQESNHEQLFRKFRVRLLVKINHDLQTYAN